MTDLPAGVTEADVERGARALCRFNFIRLGATESDTKRGVDLCWKHWADEAELCYRAMIAAAGDGEA